MAMRLFATNAPELRDIALHDQVLLVRDHSPNFRFWAAGTFLLAVVFGLQIWLRGRTWEASVAGTLLLALNVVMLIRYLMRSGPWAVAVVDSLIYLRFMADPLVLRSTTDAVNTPRVAEFGLSEVLQAKGTTFEILWPMGLRRQPSTRGQRLAFQFRPDAHRRFLSVLHQLSEKRRANDRFDFWLLTYEQSGYFFLKWERTYEPNLDGFLSQLRSLPWTENLPLDIETCLVDLRDFSSQPEEVRNRRLRQLCDLGFGTACYLLLTKAGNLTPQQSAEYLENLLGQEHGTCGTWEHGRPEVDPQGETG
jgi:hypothetical protein